MADITNLTNFLGDIADAIRTKKETTEQIPAENFDQEILSIDTIKGQEKTIIPSTAEQIITPDGDYNAITKATIKAVDNTIDSNISPENIKKDINILGVTGTLEEGEQINNQDKEITENGTYTADEGYTGLGTVTVNVHQEGGSGDIKQFATQEEMQADTTAQEGDLAVVYRSEVQNVTVDSRFQIATFPDTVVLDSAITDYVDVRYRAVDDSVMFNCWGNLDSSRFSMDCQTETGEIRIQYTSSDGITYTRTDTTGNPIDFGTEIYYERAEMWNDAIGKFIQVGGMVFEGLYEYSTYIVDGTYQKLIDTSNKTATNIPYLLPEFTTYERVNSANGSGNCTMYSGMILDVHTSHISDDGKWNIIDKCKVYQAYGGYIKLVENNDAFYVRISAYDTDVNYNYAILVDDYDFSLENPVTSSKILRANKVNSDYSDYVVIGTITGITTGTYYGKQLTGEAVLEVGKNSYTHYDAFGTSSSGTSVNVEGVGNYDVIDCKYLLAPTQLTLSQANELLPNISAYGKNGVITGDGSISDNIVDLTRELFGNTESLGIKYLNVEPYKLETKKYSLCKSNECDVALGITINGDITSGWKIFYNNGVCSNYYFDGEYYYIANVTSDTLIMYKIDKYSKLINTYNIRVSGIPVNSSTANNIGIGKYNNTWYLFFTKSASNSYTYFNYSYGTINLENSTYTNISSGTRTLYSGTVNISVMSTSISMAGNKIGIGAKLAYNTSNGGKFSYIGYLEYMNLDTKNVTTYMNNTTLVSNQNTSYIDGVKIVITDRYLVYHARYYSSSASYKAYRLSVDMNSGTKVSSSNDSTVNIYYGSPNYVGNEYAWSFNNNKAIRIKLSDGSINIVNLPDIITGMDETNSYGITVGKIYRFSGDTYTIEENKQLLNNVSGWYFTRIVETDEYFANLGITANQFYWYSKIETGNSYDLVCQSRDNTVGCKSMLPYFTAPGFSRKLKDICYGN